MAQAERWLHNIGTGYAVESFYFKGRVVCSDHFHANCFEVDMMANVMGSTSKRRNLKSGAVPTIFKHKTYDMINMNGCKVKGKLQHDHSIMNFCSPREPCFHFSESVFCSFECFFFKFV